uniref:Uncharacterized protein n=1 Tax=viral metagenome TaxID=1070528 RepID=A0A6H1ZM78_9ZZZZ
MEIKNGMVKLDKPTKEIHVYVKVKGEYFKAVINKVTQDKLSRVYIRAERSS